MKLGQKLSTKLFILSHVLILTIGLIFLGGLYFIVNIQYQKPNKPFSKGPVTALNKSLRLDLSQPDQDSLLYSSSISVSGKTTPTTEVLISTESNDLVIKSKPDGSFSTILDLDEGVNRISVTAFDASGNAKSEERTVYYSKEKI